MSAKQLTISREDAVNLLTEVGYLGSEDHTPAHLQKTLRSLTKPGVLDPENQPKSDRGKCVLADVIATVESDGEIIVEGEQMSTTEQKPKGKSKDKKPAAASKGKDKPSKAPSSPAKASGKDKGGTAPAETKKGTGAKSGAANGRAPKEGTCIGAAIRVLKEAGKPMNCQDIIETAQKKGYWTTPGGKTPAATLNASIYVDMKKEEPRFEKAGKGLFGLTKAGKK